MAGTSLSPVAGGPQFHGPDGASGLGRAQNTPEQIKEEIKKICEDLLKAIDDKPKLATNKDSQHGKGCASNAAPAGQGAQVAKGGAPAGAEGEVDGEDPIEKLLRKLKQLIEQNPQLVKDALMNNPQLVQALKAALGSSAGASGASRV